MRSFESEKSPPHCPGVHCVRQESLCPRPLRPGDCGRANLCDTPALSPDKSPSCFPDTLINFPDTWPEGMSAIQSVHPGVTATGGDADHASETRGAFRGTQGGFYGLGGPFVSVLPRLPAAGSRARRGQAASLDRGRSGRWKLGAASVFRQKRKLRPRVQWRPLDLFNGGGMRGGRWQGVKAGAWGWTPTGLGVGDSRGSAQGRAVGPCTRSLSHWINQSRPRAFNKNEKREKIDGTESRVFMDSAKPRVSLHLTSDKSPHVALRTCRPGGRTPWHLPQPPQGTAPDHVSVRGSRRKPAPPGTWLMLCPPRTPKPPSGAALCAAARSVVGFLTRNATA